MINRCWLLTHKNYEKNKSRSASPSVCKKMSRDVFTLLVIYKGSIDIDSSFDIIWKHLLQVT